MKAACSAITAIILLIFFILSNGFMASPTFAQEGTEEIIAAVPSNFPPQYMVDKKSGVPMGADVIPNLGIIPEKWYSAPEPYWNARRTAVVMGAILAFILALGGVWRYITLKRLNKAVLKTEKDWENTFDSVLDPIMILDTQYRIQRANKAFAEMLGVTPPEAVGMTCYEKFHGTQGPIPSCPHTKLLKDGKAHTEEIYEERFEKYFSVNAFPCYDIGGKLTGSVHTITNITTRKEKEKEMFRRQMELSALHKVSSAIAQTIEIDKLLDIILDTVIGLEILNIEKLGGIFVIEDDRMKLVSHRGHTEEFLDLHKNMKVGDCLCGLAAKTGEIIISNDRDDRHTIKPPDSISHGHIIVPLNARGRIVGVLYLYVPPDIEIEENELNLLVSIGNQIGTAIENARLFEETKKFSLEDPLTGLANRRMMDIIFNRSIVIANRTKKMFSAIMLDIDFFKKYNDTHGHSAGDMLLVKIAKILHNETRAIDLVVRYGGEEFFILLTETDPGRARDVAERIRKTVERTTDITISAGVASYNIKMRSKEELVEKADSALYQAKQKGRNRVEICDQ